MANSFVLNFNATLSNGTITIPFVPLSALSLTPASFKNYGTTWTVGTSAETMAFGDVTAPYYLMMYNIGPTNYVNWGPDSAGSLVTAIKLRAGDFAILPITSGITYKAQANTAACDVQLLITSE